MMFYYQMVVVLSYLTLSVFKLKQAGYFVPVVSNLNDNMYLVASACYVTLAIAYLCKSLYYKKIKSIAGVLPITGLFTAFLIFTIGFVLYAHLFGGKAGTSYKNKDE